MVHTYGLGSTSYSLKVPIAFSSIESQTSFVKETDENGPIFEELRECLKLISKKQKPLVQKWIQDISKIEPDVISNIFTSRTDTY